MKKKLWLRKKHKLISTYETEIKDNIITIKTPKGNILVDYDIYLLIKNFSFRFQKNTINKRIYISVTILPENREMLLTRLILNYNNSEIVDHINMNTLDNTRNNLRISNNQNNSMNVKSKGGSSKYKGVSWSESRKKWEAKIMINRKTIHLGRYLNEELAAKKYDEKARELFGEHGRYNFPLKGEQSALR